MWDLPGPGLEPMSPALAGRFLTTVPPGKLRQIFVSNTILRFKKSEFLGKTADSRTVAENVQDKLGLRVSRSRKVLKEKRNRI